MHLNSHWQIKLLSYYWFIAIWLKFYYYYYFVAVNIIFSGEYYFVKLSAIMSRVYDQLNLRHDCNIAKQISYTWLLSPIVRPRVITSQHITELPAVNAIIFLYGCALVFLSPSYLTHIIRQ